MSSKAIMKVIDDYMCHFSAPVPVCVVDRLSDVPDINGRGNAKGVVTKGTVYFIRAGLTGHADVVDTLFHELLHFGVRRLLSRDGYISSIAWLYSAADQS